MTARRGGLGRGLGALLGNASTTDVTTPPARGLTHIAIDRITPNPNQPRATFDDAALAELRASIAEFGVLVPIIVRARGDDYELIAGERRWRAARAAGLTTVPAIVRQADDRESLEVAIVENLQRENLNPLEEAMGFAHLMEAHEFTQEQVAQRVGRSRSAIANSLRLLTLSDRTKALVRNGTLSAGHARAILALAPERRDGVARRVVADGLSVRAVEALARNASPAARATKPARVATGREELLERLRYRFGTQVAIVERNAGGTLELRFSDEADLIRITDLLLDDAT